MAPTTLGTMAAQYDLGAAPATTQLLGALETRDFAGLESAFAPEARARFLLPPGAEEYASASAIRQRMESWFSPAVEYEMLACADDGIGPRHRLTWSLRVRWDASEEPYQLVNQVAFVDVGADGIERIDLLCSGFVPEQPPVTFVGSLHSARLSL